MTIRISQFASKHLPIIVRLLSEEYKTLYEFIPFNEERVLSQIQKRVLTIHVAEENGKVLGLVGNHLEERSEESISWLAACEEGNRPTFSPQFSFLQFSFPWV